MESNKKNQQDGIQKKTVITHILLMGVVFFMLCYIILFVIDIFTGHGESIKVPNVVNAQFSDAVAQIERQGLRYEVDSVYNDKFKPGCVIKQEPKANSDVKEHRTIYLTINALYPRMIIFPDLGTNTSERMATAVLTSSGFNNVKIQYVFSEHKGLYLGAKYNGKTINVGDPIPASAVINVLIGDGGFDDEINDATNTPESDIVIDNDNEAESSRGVDFFQ